MSRMVPLYSSRLSSLLKRRQFILSVLGLMFGLILLVCLSVKTAVDYYPQVCFSELEQVLIVTGRKQVFYCEHRLVREETEVMLDVQLNVTEAALRGLASRVKPGGYSKPVNCESKYRVNIVIPYRNREWQLSVFLYHMHSLLQLQQVEYVITVVEQSSLQDFNRGKLFNVGFEEMQKSNPANCYVFHDVDLIPLSANNIYACSRQPRHMSSSVDVFRFNLPYEELFGGAVALTSEQFRRVNGYSNAFYGWGGEDDDFSNRVAQAGYKILRYEARISRYKMLNHAKEKPNPARFEQLREGYLRFQTDGLTQLTYKVLKKELRPLYTWILVDV